MSVKNNSTFCSFGWNHQFIGPGGNVKPCCRYTRSNVPESHNIRTHSLIEVFHDSFMNDLRESFKNGVRDPGCIKCWQEEDSGKKLSIRQNYNRNIDLLGDLHADLNEESPKITWLELSFNNRCNVRCRMCGPFYSTNWYKDWELVKEYVPPTHDLGNLSVPEYIKLNPDPKTIDLSKLDDVLPNIRHLKLTGGEPFIMPEYRTILEKLVSIGQAKNVFLNYSTNLTIMPKDDLIDLWKEFKHVEFATSLDGIGPVIEYQRFPTKWSQVETVLRKLFSLKSSLNMKIGTRPTITVYNILNVPEITNYWLLLEKEFGLENLEKSWINHTHSAFPKILSVTILPNHLKKLVEEKLSNAPTQAQQKSWNHLINYMYSADDSNLIPKFKDYTLKLDSARCENMLDVIPEFKELLK
jgi:MoaA/NifB/PqqE/SkfB family radical SAM enzyme